MILKILLKNGNELEVNESFMTSFRYEDFVSNSEEIRIGVAPSATLDFSLINRDNVLSGKKFDKCELIYYNDKGERKGTFDCSEIKKNKKSIDFEMVDRMMRFEVDWKGCSFPTTTYNLLLNICGQCGISLRTEKKDIINANLTIQDEEGLAGETCRTILKYLCEIFGSYANMDENGDLLIEYYDFNTIKDKIEYGQCTYFEIDEKISRRAGVLFKNNKENVQIGDTSSSYIIEDNPIIKQLSESVKKEVGQRIVDRIKYTSLKGGEFTLSKRDLKEGDVIEVVEENGDISVCVVSKIVFENLNKMTIFSYGDTKNTKESTSTSTSSTTSETETYSSEVYLGRGQNHQRVVAKAGTYTLVEKLITNITSFSKVNLNLFVNFNYNLDKILFFDIYANDRLVKSLKYEASVGFNQFSVGFLADIDLAQNTNLYSCKITLEDGDILEIEPFECQISFIVKSCKITDAVAIDQYFVEKYNKIDNRIFNQNRFTIKTLREKITIKIPFYSFDVSKNGDGSVMADWYENGDLEVYGNGETQDNLICDIARSKFGGWSSQGTVAYNSLKEETTKIYVSGDVVLGYYFFKNTTNLEEVHFNGNIRISKECFLNCTKLTTLTGEQGIYYVGVSAFNGCNLTGTLDLSNCKEFNDYSFYNNSNLNYIYFPRPITKNANSGMEYCFSGCTNLDGIVVMDSTNSGSPHSTVFENTQISTFMFMADVEYKSTSFLKKIATPNPTLYVCYDWDDGSTWDDINSKDDIYELEEDYGFTIVLYEKEQEQEILNSLGV
jgi:hypothetical protein